MIWKTDKIPINLNQLNDVWAIPTGGGRMARFEVKYHDGTFSASVLTVVYRLTPECPWRAFVPSVLLNSSTPYTTVPVDVTGVPEIGLQVTTAEGAAGQVLGICVISTF